MAENVDQQKLLRKLSHGIRNPLSTILGYAEVLLLNGDISDEDREMLNAIKDNCKKIDTLLVQVSDEYE